MARGAPADGLFAAVSEEAGQLLQADLAEIGRYDRDDTGTRTIDAGIAYFTFPRSVLA